MGAAVAVSVLLQSGLVLPDGQNFVSTSRRQALLHAAGAASLCFYQRRRASPMPRARACCSSTRRAS